MDLYSLKTTKLSHTFSIVLHNTYPTKLLKGEELFCCPCWCLVGEWLVLPPLVRTTNIIHVNKSHNWPDLLISLFKPHPSDDLDCLFNCKLFSESNTENQSSQLGCKKIGRSQKICRKQRERSKFFPGFQICLFLSSSIEESKK